MNIPNWFLDKNLSAEKKYAFEVGEKEIETETEKAVLVKVKSDFGTFNFWCPKTILNGTCEQKQDFTFIEINGKQYVKEILIKRPFMLKQLGLTKEQVEKM